MTKKEAINLSEEKPESNNPDTSDDHNRYRPARKKHNP